MVQLLKLHVRQFAVKNATNFVLNGVGSAIKSFA
jgi:hypothetical protein